ADPQVDVSVSIVVDGTGGVGQSEVGGAGAGIDLTVITDDRLVFPTGAATDGEALKSAFLEVVIGQEGPTILALAGSGLSVEVASNGILRRDHRVVVFLRVLDAVRVTQTSLGAIAIAAPERAVVVFDAVVGGERLGVLLILREQVVSRASSLPHGATLGIPGVELLEHVGILGFLLTG